MRTTKPRHPRHFDSIEGGKMNGVLENFGAKKYLSVFELILLSIFSSAFNQWCLATITKGYGAKGLPGEVQRLPGHEDISLEQG